MKDRKLIAALCLLNAVLALTLLARGSFVDAAAAPEILRAQCIELVDSAGNVRAQLKIEDSNEAVFRMRDAKGEIRVKLGASEDGSGLALMNQATEPGIHMLAKKRGESSVAIIGPDGQKNVLTP